MLRIVTGALIGLAALPVVFTLLRTRRPELGTPQLALTLRTSSIALHVLAGVLIIGTAISEIWLSLDSAGRWLFGIYGAAAAIALLGIFAFYLAFVAELPPPPPKPLKPKAEKGRRRAAQGRRGGCASPTAEDAEESATGEDEATSDESDEPSEAEEPAESEEQPEQEPAEVTAEKTEDDAPADENTSDERDRNPRRTPPRESTGLNPPTVGCETGGHGERSPCVGAGGRAAVSPSRTSLASTWEQLIATM